MNSIHSAMNTMHHIRTKVFRVSQGEMARIAGVSQSTVSKWESGIQTPMSSAFAHIRREARRRAVPWDDKWFFEEA